MKKTALALGLALTAMAAPITARAAEVEIIPEPSMAVGDLSTYDEYMYYVGWYQQPSTGVWTYYSPALVKDSWIKENGKWYYVITNGAMAKGITPVGNTGVYYFNKYTGEMMTNKWVKTARGYNYFGKHGKKLRNVWLKDNGYWYYFDQFGDMVSNTGMEIDGVIYYFNESGQMLSA